MLNRVLIGYSSNFNSYSLFEAKLSKILSSLGVYEVVAIEDVNGLVAKYFGKSFTEIPRKLTDRKIRAELQDITHVVLFWDGTELEKFVYFSNLLKLQNRVIPVITTKVVNKDAGQPYDVYIGRGSPWGNPFPIGEEGTREEVIEKYREYFEREILTNPAKIKELESLHGKTLGCHCKPHACHGDIIAEYLNAK